jgi:fatty-acyl-CoA synthase
MSDLYRGWTYPELNTAANLRYPDRAAFVAQGREMTGREAHRLESQVMQVLAGLGIARGSGLTALSTGRPEALIAATAALRLGCHYTPLAPAGSAADHAFILQDANVAAVVFDPLVFGERATELAKLMPGTTFLSIGPGPVGEDLLALAEPLPEVPLENHATDRDLALLHYTGGTTGRPKGVMLSHRALVHAALTMYGEYEWPEVPRFLASHPQSHTPLMAVRMRGGALVMQPAFDPDAFVAEIATSRCNCTLLVPAMIYDLLDDARHRDALASLETIIYGGAPMSAARLAEAIESCGRIFMQWYSQTEAIHAVTMMRKAEHDPARPERLASCGRPVFGVDVEVHDEAEHRLAPGEAGELCVRGPVVMDGYWGHPELSAETLRNGWLHTGDVATADEDGFLTIVDRRKDMIITRGFNVFPGEVEFALEQHPGVSVAAVIGVPSDERGEDVTAFVVARRGAELDERELIDLVRREKGELHVPRNVEVTEAIPLTPAGKPDKKALRERFWAGRERQVA